MLFEELTKAVKRILLISTDWAFTRCKYPFFWEALCAPFTLIGKLITIKYASRAELSHKVVFVRAGCFNQNQTPSSIIAFYQELRNEDRVVCSEIPCIFDHQNKAG